MKFKYINARAITISLVLMMFDAGPSQAASATLSGVTGNSCTPYTSFAVDGSGNLSVICPSGGPQLNPPICSLAANPTTQPSGGGTSVLTATCNPSATTYTWSGGDGTASCSSTSSTCSVSPTSSGIHTYTVSGATVADGTGNTASATVTVAALVSGDVPANCTIIDITWAPGFKYNITPWQYLQSGKMVAFRTTVSATKKISQVGTAYAQVPEYLSISTNACDFSAAVPTKCIGGGDNDPVMWNGPGTVAGSYCNTPVGSVIYYNIKHATSPTSADTCPAGSICKFALFW